MTTRAPADLRPTPDSPGLWIAAVPSPRGSFACACGHIEHAAGARDVQHLIARHQVHRDHCVPAAALPTENGRRTGSRIRAIQGKINTGEAHRAA
ncbi:hypothetical protein [Pseudonocardia alni]|uniref:hypothetical protein n=1 Tax=Pseudonocardia alni TaxID=33907 RepID=UPI00332E510E